MQLQIVGLALLTSFCRNYALRSWEETVPAFKYNPATPYSQIFVPTADTVRFGALLTLALQVHRPVLLTGMSPLNRSNNREHCQESIYIQHPYVSNTQCIQLMPEYSSMSYDVIVLHYRFSYRINQIQHKETPLQPCAQHASAVYRDCSILLGLCCASSKLCCDGCKEPSAWL